MYPFALEVFGPVVGAVIHKEVTFIQVLVVREDEPLVGVIVEVALHLKQLVAPRSGVLPRCGAEDIGVEILA